MLMINNNGELTSNFGFESVQPIRVLTYEGVSNEGFTTHNVDDEEEVWVTPLEIVQLRKA